MSIGDGNVSSGIRLALKMLMRTMKCIENE